MEAILTQFDSLAICRLPIRRHSEVKGDLLHALYTIGQVVFLLSGALSISFPSLRAICDTARNAEEILILSFRLIGCQPRHCDS
jgi:hypothetical protein